MSKNEKIITTGLVIPPEEKVVFENKVVSENKVALNNARLLGPGSWSLPDPVASAFRKKQFSDGQNNFSVTSGGDQQNYLFLGADTCVVD